MTASSQLLSPPAQAELLALARRTLESNFTSGQILDYTPASPELGIPAGAFVTLRNGATLRGCIGHIAADRPLYATVQRCAVSAALDDLRFAAVSLAELPQVKIEISVMTAPRRVATSLEVDVGNHGLVVSRGARRGLLLPQVAIEYGWDREAFLAQTCRKAGLPLDAWRDPATVIEVFEAQVFGER